MDLALLLQLDRNHLAQALRARDAAVALLIDACTVIREKTSAVDLLKAINEELQHRVVTCSCSCSGCKTPIIDDHGTHAKVVTLSSFCGWIP
jgi:hypothetical protein